MFHNNTDISAIIQEPTSWNFKKCFNKILVCICSPMATSKFKIIFIHCILIWKKPWFVSSHMYPENPEGAWVIVSMNMGYDIYPSTARNRTHKLFRLKCSDSTRPQWVSDGLFCLDSASLVIISSKIISLMPTHYLALVIRVGMQCRLST